MRFLLSLAWRDLRASGHTLWVFCACLALGVTLIAATGGLYRQVSASLLNDTRAIMGGDLEVESREPLPPPVLEWIGERGKVSLLTELNSMLGTESGDFQIVEVQSVDDAYPLYGSLRLEPAASLDEVTAYRDGAWGLAMDGALAERLSVGLGNRVTLGELTLVVRALVRHQPDRSLRADWRGAPVLIAADALAASGLITTGSRVDREYRVRTDTDPDQWRDEFFSAFPQGEWEVHTFRERNERIGDRLGQVASGLLIIGFTTLFIGGLGVFNSIQAYLQRKLGTIATLRALGLRNTRLALVYLLQVGMLALGASIAGALAGLGLSAIGGALATTRVSAGGAGQDAAGAFGVAIMFGVLTAYAFALPAIGRALSVNPAALFRSIAGAETATPRAWWLATAGLCLVVVALVMLALPDPLFGLGFVAVAGLLLLLLDGIVLGLRHLAGRIDDRAVLGGRFAIRLALANIRRPGSPLRASLLSLGSALTLLVACAIVIGALVKAINDTIPAEAPSLVLYDIATDQRDRVVSVLEADPTAIRIDVAPLVLGRLSAVNGEVLRDSEDGRRRLESRDEHKLTYRGNNIDAVTMDRGAWWPGDRRDGTTYVAMEDREADQLGLEVGDELTFSIAGGDLTATLSGIYRQKGIQTRFWFEAIFSDGALDPFIHRYVGATYSDDPSALAAQRSIGRIAPNVVTVRTATILETARDLLGKAVKGLGVIAAISLAVSLLVLTSMIATSRTRVLYDATVLHSLGARLGAIHRSLRMEYLLLAVVTSLFAILLGSAIALPLLEYRLKLPVEAPLGLGVVVALAVSTVCLQLGAYYLMKRLRLSPALLLRSGG